MMGQNPCNHPTPQRPSPNTSDQSSSPLPDQSSVIPQIKYFADFAKYVMPGETPLVQTLMPHPPAYCQERIQEPRQPEYHIWTLAKNLLAALTPDDDDIEWWEPSHHWHALSEIASKLSDIAYNLIPNPEYDATRCAEWRKEHPGGRPFNQKKVTWGGATYTPPAGVVGVTADGTHITTEDLERGAADNSSR